MNVISSPPANISALEKGVFATPWYSWFQQAYVILFSIQQSGTTLERPVKGIWIGRRYFDTDLTQPVYVSGYTDGVVSWVDAMGAHV